MEPAKRKRVTVKPKNPNPLFEQWLTEWRDKAKESGSKMQFCFSMALKSLRKYPLPLETGKDCKILNGFGEKLCQMLDEKLVQYGETGVDIDLNLVQAPQSSNIPAPATPKKPRKRKPDSPQKSQTKEYIPAYGTGAFAVLVTLYEQSQEFNYPGFMLKTEIISKGQHLSNTSFTKPGPDSRYTAWSSMTSLLQKQLVKKEGNPARFSLSQEGLVLGEKLYIQQKIEEFNKLEDEPLPPDTQSINVNKISSPKKKAPIWRTNSTASTASHSSCSSTFEATVLAPNCFEIILLVDNRELNGTKSDAEKDPILVELKKLNVPYEIRSLKVGDYIWICRSNNTELVLPYIVERKRMDDLGHSIKDSRFHEQKFRLKQCGLQNLIYLIENYGKNEHVGLPINSLFQAATNTLIQDGFMVKFTANGRGTCEYLSCLTKFITKFYKGKTLASCAKEDLTKVTIKDDLIPLMHFKEFYKSSSKTKPFKIRDMFVKQLLQIKGMSVDKALAIVNIYPTPKMLKLAYQESVSQAEKMLANVRYGVLNKNVGPVLAKTVYQFFCNDHYS